jgi:hypothetical protein
MWRKEIQMADSVRALSPAVTRRAVVGGAVAFIAFGGRLAEALAQATPAAGTVEGMSYPELVVTVTDDAITPETDSVPAGLVLLTVNNQSSAEVGAAVIQPAEGYTIEDLQNAAATPPASPDEFPSFFYTEAHIAGGPGSPPVGGTAQAVIELVEGPAVLFAEGNQPPAFFTVTAAEGEAQPPETSVTIVEVDFAFGGVANAAPAGQQVWEVRNEGTQPHMLVLGKVPDGTTWDQVYQAVTSDPEATPEPGALGQEDFQYVGGVLLQSGGTTVYPILDLEPGRYGLICFVPDPNHGGIPHAMEGMIAMLDIG